MKRSTVLAGMVVACWAVGLASPARAQQFELGDVIVSGEVLTGGTQQFDAKLLWYGRDGQFKGVLSDRVVGRLAFSPGGVLYAASGQGIVTVSPSGTLEPGPDYRIYAFRALAFAADGSLVAGGGDVLKRYGPSGALLNSYRLTNDAEVVSLDIASDQCTAFWLGPGIRQFDVCLGIQKAAAPLVSGSDFRLLPGGAIAISRFNTIQIYSADGTLIRSFVIAGGSSVALDVDGTSIWSAGTRTLSKFDLATGKLLIGPIDTGLTAVRGLAVYGEPRAAFVNGPLVAVPALSPWMLLALVAALAALAMARL